MNKELNTKEICKQIKSSGNNGCIIWSRETNQHFVSNRHFLIRFDELPKDVLVSLFSIFFKLPEVGQTLQSVYGEVDEKGTPLNVASIYKPEQQSIEGEVTKYLKEFDEKLLLRVIKFPGHESYINEKYMKMTKDKNPKVEKNIATVPVYFANGDLILLPVRDTSKEDKKIVDMLRNRK
ncbi:hypothetical protein MMB75_05020 [Paenibacillus sp. P2(2022)]|uniref:hypothetical protein n=1 Tax=Paenibacillus sp. P2(2022) TaxID=2917813 RepID=UPI002405E221|nr:hypothetical protein [Paenibacillus sp. P2(2022)]MDG0053033.1 hypothetical protein [Paenibacillus sp. P2(2022)]